MALVASRRGDARAVRSHDSGTRRGGLSLACGDDPSGPPPKVATTIERIAGDSQIGTVSELLADSLVVAVKDQDRNLLPGAAVSWSAVSGGGAASAATTTTSATGQARVRFTLGAPFGTQTARASLANGQSVTFAFTAATHPAGVIERSDVLAARPYGAAISSMTSCTSASSTIADCHASTCLR